VGWVYWRLGILVWMALFCIAQGGCLRESTQYRDSWQLSGKAIPLGPKPSARTRSSYMATGLKSMVATAHPLATDAAYYMLRLGGNAVDAAVAASFVISVVRPQSTGIGGGGFMLYFDKKTGRTSAYDFRERAPQKATADMYYDAQGHERVLSIGGHQVSELSQTGPLAAGVPGLVLGLETVHKKFGRLPWSKVLAPSIKAAREGFPVYGSLAKALRDRASVMKIFPETAQIFYPEGRLLKEGDLLVQKDLARSLELVAQKGAAVFYQGEIAQNIVKTVEKYGGIMEASDLDAYRVKERSPVRGRFRDHTIVSMPPPSSGGTHLVQMLQMFQCLYHNEDEKIEITLPQVRGESCQGKTPLSLPHPSSAEGLHNLAEIMKRAFADRAQFMGDPDFIKVPLGELLSDSYAFKLARTIDSQRATPAQEVLHGSTLWSESDSTTHLSIVDGEGNGISTTQTINYLFGSSMVAQGTGILLNNEMDDFSKKPGVPNVFGLVGSEANGIAPGKTMLSSMSPTLVFNPNGELSLIIGSPGGPKIITATFLSVLNVIAYGMPLEDAVHYARIHHQWLPDILSYEKGALSPDVILELEKRGHRLKESSEPFGDVQAISGEGGVWVGVSDLRSDGVPRGQ
jgi:gamma-glutamyltranspeptidase/glutathione hydrolase